MYFQLKHGTHTRVRFYRELTLVYVSTEMSRMGILGSKECAVVRNVLPETNEDYGGSESEVLATMRMMYDLCGFDEDEDNFFYK